MKSLPVVIGRNASVFSCKHQCFNQSRFKIYFMGVRTLQVFLFFSVISSERKSVVILCRPVRFLLWHMPATRFGRYEPFINTRDKKVGKSNCHV